MPLWLRRALGCVLAGTRADGPSLAASKRASPLKTFPFISKSAQTLKFKTKVFLMSKNTQILQVGNLKHK
jgi:hypothetical protein